MSLFPRYYPNTEIASPRSQRRKKDFSNVIAGEPRRRVCGSKTLIGLASQTSRNHNDSLLSTYTTIVPGENYDHAEAQSTDCLELRGGMYIEGWKGIRQGSPSHLTEPSNTVAGKGDILLRVEKMIR